MNLALPMQPIFSWLWDKPGESQYERVLGRERCRRLQPFPELCRRRLVVSGGSDSPVTEVNPLLGIQAATTMPSAARQVCLDEALRMFTINGAWVGHEEDCRGSIEVGKEADLVVLGANPYDDPSCISDIPVEMTMAGGRIIYGDV